MHYLPLLHTVYGILMLSGDVHEKPSLLSVNPGLIIWTIVIFVLLLILLRKIAWGPLIKALNTREETIKSAMENAEKQNREAQELMEQNRKNLSEANAQSMKVINEAKDLAVKVKEDIINKANEEAGKIINQAKDQINGMKETAIEQMKDEISDIAVKAAEKIINANLDPKKQKALINDFLGKISKN
ncbi:ATP synthase F0 subunit B [bacterium]|nr:MAG: ATP synthase F0 subunit B [bacterium]